MSIKDARSIVEAVRDLPIPELLLLCLVLLPIVLGGWSVFLNSVSYFDDFSCWKAMILGGVANLFIVGVLLIKVAELPFQRLKRLAREVEYHLRRRAGHRASFEAIRKELDEKYTDEVLESLISLFPETLGPVTMRKYGAGIKLADKPQADDKSATESQNRDGEFQSAQ